MKKTFGDEISFFGTGDETLLPPGATCLGFAAKPTDPVFAPSFSAVNPGGLQIPTVPGEKAAIVVVPQPVSAGLHINLIWDSSVSSAPSGFQSEVRAAADAIEAAFSDPVTINIRVGWGEINGNPINPDPVFGNSYALGGPNYYTTLTYASLKAALTSDSKSAQDAAAIAAMPGNNSAFPNSANSFYVASAEEKALGLLSGATAAVDGAIGFATGWTSNWIGGALHEITHAMGRIFGGPTILDLYRYDAAGHFQWTGGNSAYLSIDGGRTRLADFGTHTDYGDFLNGGVQGPDPFTESISSNTFTAVDVTTMDVLGFDRAGTGAGSISINDMTISEGDSGSKVMTFAVTRSGGSAAFDVNFTTADGSATVADHDYVANSGTLHFNAGVNTQPVQVTITGDTKPESNETFLVNLSGATNGATISDSQGIGTISNDDSMFASVTSELAAFAPGAGGWSSQNLYPRLLADVNGDHKADIVGFAAGGVNVSLATSNGDFAAPTGEIGAFGFSAGGWTSEDRYPRLLADVNGDHMADIVGFAAGGVLVSLATGNGHFATPIGETGNFGFTAGGWTSEDRYPRLLGDVNGDGMADIVGFADGGVLVALATGNGHFAAPTGETGNFGFTAGGWTSEDRYPRLLADVNGDHMADIVGFADGGVLVALATGNGHFAAPTGETGNFGFTAGGWTSQSLYPRLLADVNADGMADIVGFGSGGVLVALATGNGHFAAPTGEIGAFGPNAGGWSNQDLYPRTLGDVNGDGSADIIGFGQAGVYEALSNGFHIV